MNKFMLNVALILFVTSCSTQTDSSGAVPAILNEKNITYTFELETVIAMLVNQKSLKLSDNVYINTSIVNLSHHNKKLSNGQLLNGRVLDKPLQIQLVIIDERCFVKNLATQELRPLVTTKCHSL